MGFMSAKGVASVKASKDGNAYVDKGHCEIIEGEECFSLKHADPRKVMLVDGEWVLDNDLNTSVDQTDADDLALKQADRAALAALITKLKASRTDLDTEIAAINSATSLANVKPPLKNSLEIIKDALTAVVKHLKL